MSNDYPNEFLKIRRPRPKGVFKMLIGTLLERGKIKPAQFQGEPKDLTDPTKLVIVYVGHATVFINFYGTTILTDPVFSNRVGLIIERKMEPGLKIDELPHLDYILISHAHLDHLNRPSLRKLTAKCETLIIPRNCSDLVEDLGFSKIIESHWTDTLQLDNLKLFTFKPQHWGTRMPWEKIARGYNSYILQKNDTSILFAGDTGYTKVFQEISKIYPIDIAMFPITAYNPPDFRVMHMNPEDAVQAFEEINAKHLIPLHWGVFRLSLEPMEEPPRLIRQLMQSRRIETKLKLLSPGQSDDFTP